MREIKFRAWDKESKKMIGNALVLNSKWLDIHEMRQYDYPFMQCTGMKDKNGIGIYEGDIVRYHHAIHPLRLITFDDGGFYYKIPECDTPHCFRRLTSGIARLDMEVIGNVYENPELLEVDLNEV